MAHDEDRRWRERMQREDDRQRSGMSGGRYGGERESMGRESGRNWSENSAWRNRGRGEWSSSSPDRDHGQHGGSWGERDRWGDHSDWEHTGWRDLERDRGRGYEYGEEFSRNFPGRDMGQSGWGRSGHDRRQDRDYGGSTRAGEYGREMGGDRSSYGGSRYGSSRGGRSMSDPRYGGGFAAWSGPSNLEYDQYSSVSAEPGFNSGHRAGPYRGGMERGYGYGGPHDWGGRGHSDDRGFWDKAADEVSSWFGDEEAERRREMDRRHSGRGPRNYARSDSRINEDVCDRLTDHPMIDASDIEVSVSSREVTLSGTVPTREDKRRAEDIAEAVSGVTHVQNNLRVKQHGDSAVQSTLDSFSNATAGAFGERGGSTMSSRSGSSPSSASGSGTGSSDTASKTTTGSSPGVMRPDPSTSSTKGA